MPVVGWFGLVKRNSGAGVVNEWVLKRIASSSSPLPPNPTPRKKKILCGTRIMEDVNCLRQKKTGGNRLMRPISGGRWKRVSDRQERAGA